MKSIHYFIHHPQDQDGFVAGLKDVFDKYTGIKWFFIRYWHGGPHIRVRFEENKEIEKHLRELFKGSLHNKKFQLSKEDYYKNHTFDGQDQDISQLPFYPNGTIKEIEYEPEFNRYGYGALMELSERGFQMSSIIMSDFHKLTHNRQAKAAMSLFMFDFFLKNVENKINFLNRYYIYWRQLNPAEIKLNQDAFKILISKAEELDLNDIYCKELLTYENYMSEIKALLNNQEALEFIISSHIHMTNNRMSVTPILEAALSEQMMKNLEVNHVV